MKANVKIIKEVPEIIKDKEWHLYFQKCEWNYEDGGKDTGYRFIWRKPDGKLQPARGQARIPSKEEMMQLIYLAETAGMF